LISSKNKWLIAATSIGILYALALLVFASDVFSKDQSISQMVSDLCMHLIPTALVLLFVVVGNKRSLVGAIIFAIFAVAYIITGWSNMHWSAHVLIVGPLLAISILYVMAYKSMK
jgi:peptidoglycan/LPS O-acetylase OafA/YrhL